MDFTNCGLYKLLEMVLMEMVLTMHTCRMGLATLHKRRLSLLSLPGNES